MLTTAAILMSLGTEPMNVRYAPSDRTDEPGTSFAKSFDEGSALAGEVKAPGADATKLKNEVDAKSLVPASTQGLGTALVGVGPKAHGSVGGKEQNEWGESKSPSPLVHGNGSAITEGVTAMGGMHSHSGRPSTNLSAPLSPELTEGQDSAGAAKGVAQQPTRAAIDGENKGAAERAGDASTEIAASVMPSIPFKDVKPMIENQKDISISSKNQESAVTKKVAKGHDGFEKTEKAAKKEDKVATSAVAAGHVIGTGPQAAIVVPVVPLSPDKQQHESAQSHEDAPSSVASVTSGQGVGMGAAPDNKADKKSQVVEKTGGDSAKMPSTASVDDSSSRKTGTDVSKTGSSTASTTDDGSTKEQSTTAVVTSSTRLAHVEPGVASGGTAAGVATHVVAEKAQPAEISSHGAAAQGGSDAMDRAEPADAMHKTLMATPTSLEVGVANGTHGWLKIRAEMTGGGVVNASLSTATSSGQEMLHRELPSLTAYLQSERVAVNTVVVQPPASAGADPRAFAGGMPSDGREQAQQSGGQGGENRQDTASTVPHRFVKEMSYSGTNEVRGDELLSLAQYTNGGNWLNVRA